MIMESKIIQISTTWVENNSTTQCSFIITALCEDGTVWFKTSLSNSVGWTRMNLINK